MTWTTADWEHFLAAELRSRVAVAFGRSRTVPIRLRPAGAALELRMHGMFAEAPAQVREDLARWLRAGRRARRACARLDAWIDARLAEEAPPPRRPPVLAPRGRHHDLASLAAPLFRDEFTRDFAGERPRPGLTWGRRARSKSRRSLRLGSYDPELHVVRVHPVLDQPAVPEWFVRFVLMHEILHAALPPRPGAGARWVHHGPDFRRRERAYPDYRRAVAWEERHLPRLIVAAREGTAFRPRVAARERALPRAAPEVLTSAPAEPVRRLVQGRLFD